MTCEDLQLCSQRCAGCRAGASTRKPPGIGEIVRPTFGCARTLTRATEARRDRPWSKSLPAGCLAMSLSHFSVRGRCATRWRLSESADGRDSSRIAGHFRQKRGATGPIRERQAQRRRDESAPFGNLPGPERRRQRTWRGDRVAASSSGRSRRDQKPAMRFGMSSGRIAHTLMKRLCSSLSRARRTPQRRWPRPYPRWPSSPQCVRTLAPPRPSRIAIRPWPRIARGSRRLERKTAPGVKR